MNWVIECTDRKQLCRCKTELSDLESSALFVLVPKKNTRLRVSGQRQRGRTTCSAGIP